MKKTRKKTIKEICKEIDLIIKGANKNTEYKYIYYHLSDALNEGISYAETDMLCETILKVAKTKNKILRYLEKHFRSFIESVPFQIIVVQRLDIDDDEELLPNYDYDDVNRRILSRFVGLARDILEIKNDSSKASGLRRAGSLTFLGEMIDYFHIPIAYKYFIDSIKSKNSDEQYAALEGLENYYSYSDDEIDDDLIETLDEIKDNTDDRTVASTCLQIQINAGVIDESTALHEMDDWKDEHYYNL